MTGAATSAAAVTRGVSIDHCGRTVAASVVAFDIRWSGELPGDREVTWAVRVRSDDGASEVELGHRRAGRGTTQYARDLSTGRTQELEADADLDGDGITVRFPTDIVGAAVEWPMWRAVIALDGEDVASLAIRV